MVDQIKYLVDKARFTDDAVSRKGLPSCWKRARYDGSHSATETIIFKLEIDGYSPIKALGSLAKDGRLRLWKVEAVLPSLLHGHNGIPIRNRHEYALAITRLHYFLRHLIRECDHERLVPGLDRQSLTHLGYIEISVQVQDPTHDLLVGSHVARLRHQRIPTAVYWGQSTRMSTRELAVVFYDKTAKLRAGLVFPSGVEMSRVETVYKNSERLSKDIMKILGRRNVLDPPPLTTLAIEDAYHLFRHGMGRVTGLGWGADIQSLQTITHSKARLIAGILGNSVSDQYRLESALQTYRQIEKPGVRTLATVDKQLRAWAFNYIAPQARNLLPDNQSDLKWAEIRWKQREDAWASLLVDLGAPHEPDPRILHAWSETRFLDCKPHPGALVGITAPGPLPFIRNTL